MGADVLSKISIDELKNNDNKQVLVMTRAMSKGQNNEKIKFNQSFDNEDIELKISIL